MTTSRERAPEGQDDQQDRQERGQQDGPGPQGRGDVDPNRWRVLYVVLVTGFMTLLDVSIVNVALPSVQSGLMATGTQLQWVLTGYAVTFGLALVPAGRLGDSYGRKKIFLVGLVVFALGSLGCGLSVDPLMLIVLRVFQGLGAGILNPQITAIINSEFRGSERGRAFGLFGAVVGLSTAVGPLLGGVIIDFVPLTDSWRFIFLVNLPVALVAFVLGAKLISDRSTAERQRLDVVGTVLLGAAVVLALVAIQEREALGWLLTVLAAVVAVALAVAFVRWERRYSRRGGLPLARPGLFKAPGYAPGVILGALYFAGFTSIFFTISLYLQDHLRFSPLQAGLAQTPFALASAVSAPVAGRAVAGKGRALVVRGLVTVVVGLALAVVALEVVAPRVGRPYTGWLLVLPFLVAGWGSGEVISPNVNLSLANIDGRDSGSASGVFQTFQRIGSGLGIAAVGSIFFSYSGRMRWEEAITLAFVTIAVLVLLSLAAGITDIVRSRRDGDGDAGGDDDRGDDARDDDARDEHPDGRPAHGRRAASHGTHAHRA